LFSRSVQVDSTDPFVAIYQKTDVELFAFSGPLLGFMLRILRLLFAGTSDAQMGDSTLSHLQSEISAERVLAIRAFAETGFDELMRLRGYVKDMQAKTRDFVLMGMRLTTDIENTGAGD
jgi:hypothetical protein